MKRTAFWSTLAGGAVLLIFAAGFFHSEKSPEAVGFAAPASLSVGHPDLAKSVAYAAAEPPAPASKGLLAMTSTPGYKRAGDLSLRVEDCTKAEDALESRLTAIKGEIVDMVMEGTEGSRTCMLTAIIPADQFRAFISDLRKMGKVQSERITASKLRPGQVEGAEVVGGPDPRELSLVSVRMADEKVAQNVLESRGILSTSFDRSASHFLKGMAVMVELVGMLLPFLIAFVAVAAPVVVVLKLRRPRTAAV
jgi:hypothetical protein